jgi:endo-1,3(4)-beta-glucanase
LIAEEVCFLDVIPKIRKFLKETIEPWLDGTFNGNGFLYDHKWGGIVTKQGSTDTGADFGFGIYNDHHYHLGYFLYGIAVLAKIDPIWGRKYKPQAYSLMADFMNLSRNPNSNYTRLRCFDLFKLHSWLYCTCWCLISSIEIVSINVLNSRYISYCFEFLSSDDANLFISSMAV